MPSIAADALSSLRTITSEFEAQPNLSIQLIILSIFREGGLGEAVLAAVADQRNIVVKHLAVPEVPRSGPPTVLIDMYGISARHVIAAVGEILKL